MNYLLDTATWSNAVTMPDVLPARVRRILENAAEIKGLSSISLLECAIHHRRGRLQISGTLNDFFEVALANDIRLLDVTPEIALATNELPEGFPGDPFDRTIAATARAYNLTLVTPDEAIRDANFCKVQFYPFRPGRR